MIWNVEVCQGKLIVLESTIGVFLVHPLMTLFDSLVAF